MAAVVQWIQAFRLTVLMFFSIVEAETDTFPPLAIDVSQNCGSSKTIFSGVFGLKMPLFDRKSPICYEVFCRYSNSCCGLRRWSFAWFAPKVPTKNRPSTTQNRPSTTQNRPDATFLCHLETLLGTSVCDANFDLRRIVSDSLTSRNRVGWAESGFVTPHRFCKVKRGE